MAHPKAARIFSSREFNASQMTELLRGLDLLITCRYHASVLSLAAQIPQIAVGHDLRLKSLYQELHLEDFFVEALTVDLDSAVQERIEKLLGAPDVQREVLCHGFSEHLARAQHNRELLRAFVREHGWDGSQ